MSKPYLFLQIILQERKINSNQNNFEHTVAQEIKITGGGFNW